MWALFAVWSCERCEATVEECLSIEEKWSCKVNEFYSRKLAAHHDPQSGYQTTWSDFINAGQGTNQCLPIGGPATVNVDCGPLVNELWPFVMPLINDCICHMKPLLQQLGVDKNELSPFSISLMLLLIKLQHIRTILPMPAVVMRELVMSKNTYTDEVNIEVSNNDGRASDPSHIQDLISSALDYTESEDQVNVIVEINPSFNTMMRS